MARRRNRSNELIVAIAVIGTLAVALTFGIILTLSSNVDNGNDDDTPETDAAIIQAPTTTDGPTATVTVSPEPATNTPTPTLKPTEVAALPTTDTPTPRSTNTNTPKPTNTVKPTETATVTPSTTATHTPTFTATVTPSPTATHTATFTATATPSPTKTNTPTRTHTPSHTPTDTLTYTPSPTLTFTPYPTLTPSITPFSGDQTRTPSAGDCVVPPGWITYTIQSGDTLFRLAQRFGLDHERLAWANCIEDPANITAGQLLYVPPGSNVTPVLVSTAQTQSQATPPGIAQFNCDNPTATITDPKSDTVLRGTVALYGTAIHADFQFYRLQIAGGSPEDSSFRTLDDRHFTPVTNGELGTLDTRLFAPGYYWLRLTVVDNTGNFPPECIVRVRIER